jgi:Family of unknown function (DUF6134)
MTLQPGRRGKTMFWGVTGFLLVGLVLGISACSRCHPPLAIGQMTQGPSEETRDFEILVDGKPAGDYRMEINRVDERTVAMSGQAAVHVKYLFYSYSYSYRGTETYCDDRLVGLQSTSNDNGKEFRLSAQEAGDLLRVSVNGEEKDRPVPIWTTSYWRLPPKAPGKEVMLMEPDTGIELRGSLEYLGTASREAAGRKMECRHYRVMVNSSPVNLWYDEEGRLVRQEYIDDGHPTVLTLKSITRSN